MLKNKNYINYQKQPSVKIKQQENLFIYYYSSPKINSPLLGKSNINTKLVIFSYEKKKKKNAHDGKFLDEIDNLSNFDDIIYFIGERVFNNNYLLQRITELKELCDSEQDCEISIPSLKSMLLFIFVVKNFSKPSLVMNENGCFQLSWRKDRNNLITLRFKDEYLLDYVIFKASHYIEKRIVLNGSMNILDFIDYMYALKLTLYQEV